MNLLLVRHGEISSNVKKIYAGKSPEKLTEKGICQAKNVAEKIKNYNVQILYSSPVERALQTAEIIGETLGIEVIIENAFREMELGPWEGLSEKQIAKLYPIEWKIWQKRPAELKMPKRETLEKLLKRVLRSIKNLYEVFDNHNIVIVTHVAIIRVLQLWHTKKSLNFYKTIHVPNAKFFKIRIESCP